MLPVATIKKLQDLLFLITLAVITTLPLLSLLTSDHDDIRRTEKRKAAELPVPRLDKEVLTQYPTHFESFFDDHFGFREKLIYLHNYFEVFVFGVSPSKRVVLGKDRWLFYNTERDGNPIQDYRRLNLLSENQLVRKANHLIGRNNWLSQQGIKYVYVIVPNKSSIYPDQMPNNINRIGKYSLVDQFVAFIKQKTNISIIDLRPELTEARKTAPVYGKTGTHWNDFGAYVAGNAILKQLNTWFQDIQPQQIPQELFSTQLLPGEDLALMLGMDELLMEETIVGPNNSLGCGSEKPIETPRFTTYWGRSFSLDCNESNHRALVFRDSFSEKLVPYLSDQFGTISYVWTRPNDKAFEWFVNKHKPDVVMEIHVERYLRNYP